MRGKYLLLPPRLPEPEGKYLLLPPRLPDPEQYCNTKTSKLVKPVSGILLTRHKSRKTSQTGFWNSAYEAQKSQN